MRYLKTMKHQAILLRTLADTPEGLTPGEIASLLRIRNEKGIGSRLRELKENLAYEAIGWDEVVHKEKTKSGTRWKPGPRIERAARFAKGKAYEGSIDPAPPYHPGPVAVLRTLGIQEKAVLFELGVANLPQLVDQQVLDEEETAVLFRGEVYIDRIEVPRGHPQVALPAGCDQHGDWVRGRYDRNDGFAPFNLEAVAIERTMARFGVAGEWEKRVPVADLEHQLAIEQAPLFIDREEGWRRVHPEVVHRYLIELEVGNWGRMKPPGPLALRAHCLISLMRDGEQDFDGFLFTALRGRISETIESLLDEDPERREQLVAITHDDGRDVSVPLMPEVAAQKQLGFFPTGDQAAPGQCTTWTFSVEPEYESELIGIGTEHWQAGEQEDAKRVFRSVLRGDPRQIEALTCLGSIQLESEQHAEATALFQEAVYQGRDAISPEFDWTKDRIKGGYSSNQSFLSAYYHLAMLRARDGRVDESTELFEELLRLSPNDHLGARIKLMNLWMENGRHARALALARRDRTIRRPRSVTPRP